MNILTFKPNGSIFFSWAALLKASKHCKKGGENKMKLEKAIELLKLDLDNPGAVDITDLNQAQELGIEALTFIRLCREHDWDKVPQLFHGETPDTTPP